MAEPKDFKHLSLDLPEEEELVVHAGSPVAKAATEETARVVSEGEPSDAKAAPAAGNPAPPAENSVAAPADAGSEEQAPEPRDARHQELQRRAEELAAAEEGLAGPGKVSRMQLIVLLALALVLVGFVAYMLLRP